METKSIIVPAVISILVAIVLTYLVLTFLPLIVAGVLLLIVASIIFGAILAATWFILQLVLLPYYALRKVKPREDESRGGYTLEEVKPAKSEGAKPEKLLCPQCGTEYQLGSKFCRSCGAELE